VADEEDEVACGLVGEEKASVLVDVEERGACEDDAGPWSEIDDDTAMASGMVEDEDAVVCGMVDDTEVVE